MFTNIIKQIESQGKQIFHLRLPKDIIPTPEKYHLIKPIEEIIFIGYPAGKIDPKYLLPIVRRGITSTPILAEFMGYKVFLIDAFIYGGSSGSPVFILDDSGTYSDGKGKTIAGGRFFLVGILSKRQVVTENYEIVEIESVHGIKHKQLLNLGTIFHAQLIKDTIDPFLTENKIL